LGPKEAGGCPGNYKYLKIRTLIGHLWIALKYEHFDTVKNWNKSKGK
jgi:hypothetical protein